MKKFIQICKHLKDVNILSYKYVNSRLTIIELTKDLNSKYNKINSL